MKLISRSSEMDDVLNVGGKGHQLQKLCSWRAHVAPFIILKTNAYREFLEKGEIPEIVAKEVEEFLSSHPKVALRSSMIGEDALDASFAGMFETILNVDKTSWKESLKKVYSSLQSERVREYLGKKSIVTKLEMAVVVQEMIACDKSGVVFTRSPVTPTSVIAIDAAPGLGEGVVSGHVDVDHFQFTRSKDLVLKVSKYDQEVLSSKELDNLLDESLRLEKEAGFPSDIEWGIKGEQLYIFQIRPITRAFEPLKHFVDTNLSESYPGTVSPFTAQFVKLAYENVFRESAILLGARGNRLDKLNFHYKRLISCVDNHLYYNIEHYYAVLRALPGGEKNITNWHRMIGGDFGNTIIPYHDTKLSSGETFYSIYLLLKTGLQHKKIFSKFVSDLEILQQDIEHEISNAKDPESSVKLLSSLINRPLGFGLTVVNDVFIMIGLGYLSKALKKQNIPEDMVIDLLKTSHGVDSIKPLVAFEKVIQNLSDVFIQKLKAGSLKNGSRPYDEIFSKLKAEGHTSEVQELQDFLREYGDRSFEELKLESLPLKNNPELLLKLLSWGKNNTRIASTPKSSGQDIEFDFVGKKVLTFTKQAIEVREATRLWRGKFYHLLRRLVLQLASQLMETNSRWKNLDIEDFFSLSHIEWLEYANGRMSIDEAFQIIISRREWKQNQRHYPETITWVESELLPSLDMKHQGAELSGQGVSAGSVEATALVLDKPDEALTSNIKDFILVTKNTDPAWVYIMSRSRGLISEKGSLLSHTAIIGRELAIPTIVGVRAATQKIKTGDKIRIDAQKGTIEIL